MKQKSFSLRSRLGSFRYAWFGLRRFFRDEHNARVHLAATIALAALIAWLKPTAGELATLLIVAGMVWLAELFNTAAEKTLDLVSKEQQSEIGYIKDLAAAAVLVASLTAAGVAAIILIPKMSHL